MSARDWTPADWLAAEVAPLALDRAAPRVGRIRYRAGRSPLLRRARTVDQEPSQ